MIVLAFDSFKGCISASEACQTASEAIKELIPDAEVIECPLSDGGEGLVDCIRKILPVKVMSIKAHGPLAFADGEGSDIIDACYVLSEDGKTAYMEMAATSGLPLVPIAKRNPMLTTTYGVGDMIVDAASHGVSHIIMGIGGSATCDGGKGMIQAIQDSGVKFQDLPRITVACDVTNPLYGEKGAAYVFAPQKGATAEQVVALDRQLRAFAQETEEAGLATPELAEFAGAGAAGGLGYGLMAYLGAELKSGIDIMLDIADFDQLIKNADLVITGEGKSDAQTLMGKLPEGVLKRCRKQNVPVWLLSGCIDDEYSTLADNFDLVKSINEEDNRSLEVLMQPSVAKQNLKNTLYLILHRK